MDRLAKNDLEMRHLVNYSVNLVDILLGRRLLDHVRDDGAALPDVALGLHPARAAAVVTVPHPGALLRPGLQTREVDALVAVLAHKQVLGIE